MTQSIFETAHSIARYYGFEPIDAPKVTPIDVKVSKQIRKPAEYVNHDSHFCTEAKVACMRHFLDNGYDKATSVQVCHIGTACDTSVTPAHAKSDLAYSLHIVGTKQAIAEALMVKAALAMLEHLGYKEVSVRVNSVGTRDNQARYARELSLYSKKIAASLDTKGKEVLKRGVVALARHPDYAHIRYEMPHSLTYLNEESRRHFEEVLEYFERNDIAYDIDPTLIGSPSYSTDTVFEIICGDEVLVSGSRHNQLARRIGGRKDVPTLGALIHIPKLIKKTPVALHYKDAKVFFVQLGFDAKLKSLTIIDALRRARIPVYQSLSKDRISIQLAQAQSLKMPYVLIMGQQEAVRNTILIRNMETRSQDTVPIEELIPTIRQYLNK